MSHFRPSDFVRSRRGFYLQSGSGLGNFLGTAFKTIAPHVKAIGEKVIASPVVKDVLSTAKKSALDAGLQLAADTLKGKNKNLGEKLGNAKQQIADTIENSMSTSSSRKRKVKSNSNKYYYRKRMRLNNRKSKTRHMDIFDEDFV